MQLSSKFYLILSVVLNVVMLFYIIFNHYDNTLVVNPYALESNSQDNKIKFAKFTQNKEYFILKNTLSDSMKSLGIEVSDLSYFVEAKCSRKIDASKVMDKIIKIFSDLSIAPKEINSILKAFVTDDFESELILKKYKITNEKIKKLICEDL